MKEQERKRERGNGERYDESVAAVAGTAMFFYYYRVVMMMLMMKAKGRKAIHYPSLDTSDKRL